MNLFRLLREKSPVFLLFIILLGLVSSLTNVGILMLINTVLKGDAVAFFGKNNYLAFIGLMLISFLTTAFFQNYMVVLTNNIMYDLELSIVKKVRNASFESFEHLGYEKIYAAISDARVLGRVPEIFVTLINSAVTIVCSLCYLLWVSAIGGIIVLVIMTILLLVYLYRNKSIEKDMNEVRDLQDSYYKALREMMNGFKQIRISALRNNNLFNKYILNNRNSSMLLNIRTAKKYVMNELTGVYSWYIVLGVTIFLLPALLDISLAKTATFIVAILFMMSPISQLIIFFPFYTTFKIAVERITRIDKQLEVNALPIPAGNVPPRSFKSIRFENLVYKYNTKDNQSFLLDLPELELSRKEIHFIIGGNGSGKTTFINVLTGLCKPESGNIYIDGRNVSWEEFCTFSNSMAVVYTNQHLFAHNYDEHDLSAQNGKIHELEQMLNLKGVLRIFPEKNWVDTALSKGQQKRLALMLALLEDKPIIILDEWAAEQDPYNRRLFYTKWLQTVREMGKTVIAVSHDDDFYYVADRVIKFNYGKVTSDTRQVRETI